MNFQNCHNQIFMSPDFSYESLYQAIRRSYRFLQTEPVNIYIIKTDTMENVIQNIQRKDKQFKKMQEGLKKEMTQIYTELKDNENLKIKKEIKECSENIIENDNYKIQKGDSIQLIKNIQDESIHISIFSPPFADLYTYSDKMEDLGNSNNVDEFFEHFEYLIEELYRVMLPGRLVAVHSMDLPIQKGKEGYIGVRDFSGKLINAFNKQGFIYHSRVTIWKDPVIEMQRTKALGLLHKQIKKDSSMSRVGMPDYLLLFRKDGENPEPIKNKNIPVDLWQKYASPIWYDVNQTKTLQYFSARDERDEKHICPLQLDTIERAIMLWSNMGDIVFDPFMGIGSTGYKAIDMGRKFIGFELKDSYYAQAEKNLNNIILKNNQINVLENCNK